MAQVSSMRRMGERWWVQALAALTLGAGVGLVFWMAAPARAENTGLRVLLFFILLSTANTLAHELGHALGFVLSSFRLTLLAAGPFSLARRNGRLRPRLGLEVIFGGVTMAYPLHERSLARRLAVATAMGPLAQFSLGVAAIAASLLAPPSSGLESWLLAAGMYGLFFSLYSLAPFRGGGFMSDGSRLRALLQGGEEAELICALASLAAHNGAGQRPAQWNARHIRRLVAPGAPHTTALRGHLYYYWWALDRDDLTTAGRFLDYALAARASAPWLMRATVPWEAAYFDALHRRDPARARLWLDETRPGLLDEQHIRLRAEAAVQLLEGRPGEALRLARQGLEALPQAIDPGLAHASEAWLKDLERRAQAALAALGEPPPGETALAAAAGALPVRRGFPWLALQALLLLAGFAGAAALTAPPNCTPQGIDPLRCKLAYVQARAAGAQALARHDYSTAIAQFTAALALDDGDEDAYYQLGRARLGAGGDENARAGLEAAWQAIFLSPGSAPDSHYLTLLEQALRAQPDPHALVQRYRKAAAASPGSPYALCRLSLAERHAFLVDDARRSSLAGSQLDESGRLGWCWEE